MAEVDIDSPFALPEHRRPLRHGFYLRHPRLDERSEEDRRLDAEAYVARSPRPEVARAQADRAEEARVRLTETRGVPADAVRDFLAGRTTLADLREALGGAEVAG